MKTVLTIAGSDCSGGAGIQADLKTIGAYGLYGMSVITAVTSQNTQGVRGVWPVPAEVVRQQLSAVFEDIFPDAVKIGMIAVEDNLYAVADCLRKYRDLTGKRPFVVIDPVLVSTSGRPLLDPPAKKALTKTLFPLADLITPNLPEACSLGSTTILSGEDMSRRDREREAKNLSLRYGCSVLIKGGHGEGASDDFLYNNRSGTGTWYCNERIENENTHGTGCTLSSAIACGMAQGDSLEEAVGDAKEYITGAIRDGMDLGKGNGPLNHFYRLQSTEIFSN